MKPLRTLLRKILTWVVGEYGLLSFARETVQQVIEQDLGMRLAAPLNLSAVSLDIHTRGETLVFSMRSGNLAGIDRVEVDIYPVFNPEHPHRHLSFYSWNTPKLSLQADQLDFRLNCQNLQMHLGNQSANHSEVFQFRESSEYRIEVTAFEGDQKRIQYSFNEFIFGTQPATAVEQIYRDLTATPLHSAVWFMTWKCNMRCTYCWEVQRIDAGELKPEKLTSYLDWLEPWNRLRPQILDISGGEPFLQADFIEFLQQLDADIRVSVTTNLSHDITRFVQEIPASRIQSMTCSLHPSQRNLPFDQFAGRVLLLKNRGFKLTVNFVAWPEQIWLIPKYKAYFEEQIGVAFHVDPYFPTPTHPFEWTQKELNFLEPYVGADRQHWFEQDARHQVLCSGGLEHISVQPNGDIYRCMTDPTQGIGPLGNLKDPSFRLNQSVTACDVHHLCHGCDKDKIRAFPVGSVGNATLDSGDNLIARSQQV